jgi:hypothetical protein
MPFFKIQISLILSLLLMLTGCGGGGGSGGNSGDVAATWVGTKQIGLAGSNTNMGAATIDANGNVYIAGNTDDGLDGNTLTGTIDLFVTKYNSGGVKQFTQQFGVTGLETNGQSVATDTNNNVYVAGFTNGALDGNTLTGAFDFFVTKYDSNGVKQFTRQLGVAGFNTFGYAITTDANDNVYVTGETNGGLDGNTLTGTQDFFVTKYNSNGVKQFTQQLGVAGSQTNGQSVATDGSGNVYVAGYTSGGLDGNTLIGVRDFFVTKYDSTGVKQYTKQLGVAGSNTFGNAITTDANDNVYVTGNTDGGLDGNTLTGSQDLFVIKYDSTGDKKFTKQLGVAGSSTRGRAITTDANDNVYVAGTAGGGLDGNAKSGSTDFFVIKYDSTGEKQFTQQLGGEFGEYTEGGSVITDAANNVYVAGETTGGLDGNTRIGNNDSFVTKYNSVGVKQ